jgi:hypothetical protein
MDRVHHQLSIIRTRHLHLYVWYQRIVGSQGLCAVPIESWYSSLFRLVHKGRVRNWIQSRSQSGGRGTWYACVFCVLSGWRSREHRLSNSWTQASQTQIYVCCYCTESAFVLKYVVRRALDVDIIGNSDHLWLFSEAVTALLEAGFWDTAPDSSLDSDREIASALSGTGLMLLDVPQNDHFDNAMKKSGTNTETYADFISRNDAP